MFQIRLDSGVRNRLIWLFVRESLEKSRNNVVGTPSFDRDLGSVRAEISANSSLGPVLVKISDVELTPEEIEGIFESFAENRVYEAIVIAPNVKEEDRRSPPVVLYNNKVLSGWLRVRELAHVMEHIIDSNDFVVSFDGQNVSLNGISKPPSQRTTA